MDSTQLAFMCSAFLVFQAVVALALATVSWHRHFGPRPV
jgi:hypothetical protein